MNLKKYRKIVGDRVIDDIYRKTEKLKGKHIVYISSTHQGGGVAEILNSVIFLFNEVGIDLGWRIIHGNPDFFNITKKFHNAIQGDTKIKVSDRTKKIYEGTNKRFSVFTHLPHDLIVVHDPQPLPLIDFYEKKQPWIFRCRIDLTNPNTEVSDYLRSFIKKYDHAVVSSKKFKSKIPINSSIIYPSIDPLSPKNKKLSEKSIDKCLTRYGIDLNRPIISQISRFDRWKDPLGVVKIFEKVKKKIPECQLVLLGNLAVDDPEGIKVYNKIMKKCKDKKEVIILLNASRNDVTVNSLQRKSDVIIQKSIKEGFGLVVTEALYKGTPVVGSNVGGIPLQIKNNYNGFLHEPRDLDGFSDSIIKLLENKDLRDTMGRNARAYIKDNFLITRLMNDWLDLFNKHL